MVKFSCMVIKLDPVQLLSQTEAVPGSELGCQVLGYVRKIDRDNRAVWSDI